MSVNLVRPHGAFCLHPPVATPHLALSRSKLVAKTVGLWALFFQAAILPI